MKFKHIVKDKNRSTEEEVNIPSYVWFFEDDMNYFEKRDFKDDLDGATVINITHTDADGLGSGALIKEAFGDDAGVVTAGYHCVFDIEESLEFVISEVDTIEKLFITDLALRSVKDSKKFFKDLEWLVGEGAEVYWYDHHPVSEEVIEKAEDVGVDVVIEPEAGECGASITYRELQKFELESDEVDEVENTPEPSALYGRIGGDYNFENGETKTETIEFSESVEQVVELTRDRDLWIRESEVVDFHGRDVILSDLLSTFVTYSDAHEYMETIFDLGRNFYEDPNANETILEAIEKKEKRIEYVREHNMEIREHGGTKVALTYGRASPSDLSEELGEELGVNLLIHAKPKGSMSLRGRGFEMCNDLADKFGGGGHDEAAGGEFEINSIGEYVEYWDNRGREKLDEVFEEFVEMTEDVTVNAS